MTANNRTDAARLANLTRGAAGRSEAARKAWETRRAGRTAALTAASTRRSLELSAVACDHPIVIAALA
jgi:hypothetical protein